jgi:DNA repair protein RadC
LSKKAGVLEYHLTLKELPVDLRPRERLRACGPEALSTAELLAILLRTGVARETALELAHRLLAAPGGLRYLAEANLEELKTIRGIGLAKAAQIKAAIELGRRLSQTVTPPRPVIKSPQDAARLVMEEMRYLDRETFRVIALNKKNQVIKVETVSVGTLDCSLAHPREVFKNCLKQSAAAVILVHNHPSGDPTLSQEDIALTKRLVEAGKILGIEVLDHLVVGENSFTSFKEKGLIS